jgi:cytidylate kinase
MIITIARECGSGGHAIGELIAQHYGIRCYDRHILVSEAKAKGVYHELETFFSEKPFDSLLYSIAVNHGSYKSTATLNRFKELIKDESFVLIGRCGNVLYRNEPDVTSFFVHADKETKIDRTVTKQHMDRIKAEELIEYVDSKRAAFHEHYTGGSWGDARQYHMAVNSSILGVEKTADMMIDFIDKR